MNCPHCGAENSGDSKFCQGCGGSMSAPAQQQKETTGLQPNVAGLLCYVLGWVTGLVFLLIERKDGFVRFHAMQSLITFGILQVIIIIFVWIPIAGAIIGGIVGLLAFALWILLMLKAYSGERFKLPIIGDLAERIMGKV